MDGADPAQQIGGGSFLEQEAGSAAADGGEQVLVQVEGGEHHDARRLREAGEVGGGKDLPGGLQPVHPWHPDIHEHHVARRATHHRDSLCSIPCLAHDDHVLLRVDHHCEPCPHQLLVVDEDHPDLLSHRSRPPR